MCKIMLTSVSKIKYSMVHFCMPVTVHMGILTSRMPTGSMHSIGPIEGQAAYKLYNMCQARKRKHFHVGRTGRRDEGSTRPCNQLNKSKIR